MNDKDLQQLIKEVVAQAKNSLKNEDSNIAGEVKASHKEIKIALASIDQRIKTANSYTAKHEQRLNSQDVFNAQTTMTQTQTLKSLDEMLIQIKDVSKRLEDISEFKNEAEGSLATFKWLFGLFGIGGLATIIGFYNMLK